ncbi:YcjF family protein [Nitrosomonas sp.]|uniref:YcjF family protein n=1 Tax=Nitrosomonas sp. TaxID=42353 RepID=UPI0025E8944F|nr:GTPase [Nitrosomonas sp.]
MIKLSDVKNWTGYWEQLRTALLEPKVDPTLLEASLRDARAKMPVPVIWLLGKTQSGKTSIIRALTGSETAEIGNGFQPCTRSSRFYDFPAETPIVKFLDTPGLGVVSYDPGDDMQYCEAQAHLLVAVMKVADFDQAVIFDVLHAIRKRQPEWPVLLVQTGLHDLYPDGCEHLQPWPYGSEPLPETIPLDLRRAIQAQRAILKPLPGFGTVNWVAVDLTLPEDGFEPPDYGLEALWQAIESMTSLGLQHQLGGDQDVQDLYARTAHSHIVGFALAAAGLGALPVVDLVAVSAVQAKLLHSLASLYGQRWDRSTVTEFLGLAGAGIASGYVARWLSRAVIKVIPFWGQTAGAVWGASSSGATTYALGKIAIYFFERRKDGLNVDADTLRHIYAEELKRGAAVLKSRLREQV